MVCSAFLFLAEHNPRLCFLTLLHALVFLSKHRYPCHLHNSTDYRQMTGLPSKSEEQKATDRAEAEPERVSAEIVYAPMVAEAHEYQYNADAFEARGGADMKMETEKEVTKVREEKAR